MFGSLHNGRAHDLLTKWLTVWIITFHGCFLFFFFFFKMLFIRMLWNAIHEKQHFEQRECILFSNMSITRNNFTPTFQASLLFVSTTSLPRIVDSNHGFLVSVEMPVVDEKTEHYLGIFSFCEICLKWRKLFFLFLLKKD